MFLQLADEWTVWDNEGDEPVEIANSDDMTTEEVYQLLNAMTVKETSPGKRSASRERALKAMQLAYEDAKAENARWGLPMIPQDWTEDDWKRARERSAAYEKRQVENQS